MIPRNISNKLKQLATQYPVVTLTGPRQSGKSTLCRACFSAHQYVSLEDLDNRQFAEQDPRGFLASVANDGVILDEIQRAPNLPSYIQGLVDSEPDSVGRFILTGSQQFEVSNTVNQSLAGRSAILKLLPFSLAEIQNETAAFSLNDLLYTGFFPKIHDKHLNPSEASSFYLATYIERDIRQLINIKDFSSYERFLRLCAVNVGQLMNYSRLANDLGVDSKTVQSWISILKASFIVYELAPYYKNYRKRLTKSTKLYFTDVGLLCYLLGIYQPEHLDVHPLKGVIFENFIVMEFLKDRYNKALESNLYFFRDHVGNEVDLILDGGFTIDSVEIKLAQTIHASQLKGLDFLQKIAGNENRKKYLVYTGENINQYHDIEVCNYRQLPALFATFAN